MDFNVWATCPKCNKLHVISINIQRNGLLEPIMPSFNMNCESCNCEFTVQTTLKIDTIAINNDIGIDLEGTTKLHMAKVIATALYNLPELVTEKNKYPGGM